ncbi:hypothetical protein MMC08_001096 [Hypocenomyce scalaris]|nr:hypothetical protein [Hypocenomyce scalaris]
MLDFLYPVQTLALIRRFSGIDGKGSRARQQNQVRLPCSRAYTSDSAAPSAGTKGDLKHTLAPGQTREARAGTVSEGAQVVEPEGQRQGKLDKALALLERQGHEEAWRLYQDMQGPDALLHPSELTKLLDFFATSSRKIDAKRSIMLIDLIPLEDRRAINYNHAIIAALRLDKLEKAASLHREASLRIQGSYGTAALLLYTVVNENWQAAVKTWDEYWQYKQLYFERPDIWTDVDAIPLPQLIDKAVSAGQYALRQLEGSDLSGLATGFKVRDFAIQLIIRTLHVRGIHFDTEQHLHLLNTLKALRDLNLEDYKLAIYQLLSTNDRTHGRAAIKYYRDLRKHPGLVPDLAILKVILAKFRQIHSAFGTRLVLSDYRKYHGGPTANAYREIIYEEAYQGDADTVHDLFNERCSRFGTPNDLRDLQPLLIVHSRRVEVDEVCKQFHRLTQEFGIEPDVKSWNIVIAAHTRAGDVGGALRWFAKLLDSKTKPDSYSFGTMMAMYANRGDIEAVAELLEQSKSAVDKMTSAMVDSLVLAHIKNDDVEAAEKMVKSALDMDLEGTKTRMWNYLLNAYALRGDIQNLGRVHIQMKEAAVPLDNMTYAALMHGLVVLRRPEDAKKILQVVMPKKGIRATATHYAVVMAGYLLSKQYPEIFGLYRRMLQRNVKPALSTQTLMIKAAADADQLEHKMQEITDANFSLSQAEAMLEQAVSSMNPMDIAAREPLKGIGMQRLDEAFVSTHFDHLIFMYGRHKAFDKVSALYDKYIETAKRRESNDHLSPLSPPTNMLSALMVAHLQAKDYKSAEQCWDLAKEKAAELASRARLSDTSEPGWVLHSRRFILNVPLLYYMKALNAQDKLDTIAATIEDLQSSGYALDNNNWNLWIQILARSKQVLKAFKLCEEELMSGWGGWVRPFQRRELFQPPGVRLFKLAHLRPYYRTMVNLAEAFVDVQRRNADSGKDTEMEALGKEAPRTMAAVTSMPRYDDDLQTSVLLRR